MDHEHKQYTHYHSYPGSTLVMAGVVLVLFVPMLAISTYVLGMLDPTSQHIARRLQPPSPTALCGTDELGRDMLSRVLHGTVPTLGTALLVVGSASIIGTTIGLIAGSTGGYIDLILMRLADIFLAFPSLVLALVLASLIHAGLTGASIAISLAFWPTYTRLTRDRTRIVITEPYISAARALGASYGTIITRHIMPQIYDLVLVQASTDLAAAIAAVAGLSYIGLGASVSTPEWGVLINEGYAHITTGAWWLATYPTLALILVCAGALLISDGIRDWRTGRSYP